MTTGGWWLGTAVPVLVLLLLARALWAAAAVELSARWLLTRPRCSMPRPIEVPWLVVLLPMLREQAVAEQAIAAFTALDYPHGQAAVVAITTEREDHARTTARTRLPQLAGKRQLSAAELHGLFPAARCQRVADLINAVPLHEKLDRLTRLFDAEPTTAQVIATLRQPGHGALPLVHLHQPAVGGRKAGQLNHAVEHLDQVLGPLGWNEAEHGDATYVIVYDADALPDARTLEAFATAAHEHRAAGGRWPALVQQQRLPLLARRPFPAGPLGLVLTEEWVYQLRRSLGIELARVRLYAWLSRSPLPEVLRMWLRPMVYGVGCGMAVHLPAVRTLGGFPEPMEDLGCGHRLSLLGADLTACPALVLDEPYTEPRGLTNLHALAFSASARPDRHAKAVIHQPGRLTAAARLLLMAREWADEAAWLLGAPLFAASVVSAWWAGPAWAVLAAAGVLLHGPLLTTRLLALAPALHAGLTPPEGTDPPRRIAPVSPASLIAASPIQPFIRLAGPWRLLWRRTAGRHYDFGKTER
ncbi:hypothetical protein ACPXCO_23875 [Streptomyces cyaneofuscatus]|uniref:hypothetical protein n=1 Tax=Streptomyces cyaneofuscatus TaxID=66883 RepID=UPI003CE88514